MDGGNLRDVVARAMQAPHARGTYRYSDAARWATQVASALAYLHDSRPTVGGPARAVGEGGAVEGMGWGAGGWKSGHEPGGGWGYGGALTSWHIPGVPGSCDG